MLFSFILSFLGLPSYELPGGWLAELLLRWWIEARLKDMFRYRHEVTKKECE